MKIWRKRLTELINHKAVYRTAPATPGLLNTLTLSTLYKNLILSYDTLQNLKCWKGLIEILPMAARPPMEVRPPMAVRPPMVARPPMEPAEPISAMAATGRLPIRASHAKGTMDPKTEGYAQALSLEP